MFKHITCEETKFDNTILPGQNYFEIKHSILLTYFLFY